MEIIKTERSKEFTVSGATPEQIESLVADLPFYVRVCWTNSNHETVSVDCGNKREGARVREMLEQPATPAENHKTAQRGNNRRPELVEVAERDGLNRGKGWIARDYDVDRLSLHPAWVGRAICYVYE